MRRMILMGIILVFLSLGCASSGKVATKEPPALRAETRPSRPFQEAVWVDGYWRWNGYDFVWVAGKWMKPKKGHAWAPGHWQKTPKGWQWKSGYWKK